MLIDSIIHDIYYIDNMNYVITGRGFTSPLILEICKKNNYKVITGLELSQSSIYFQPSSKIYLTDESSISIVLSRMKDYKKAETINNIKDKFICRELTKNLYPTLFFKSINVNQLHLLNIKENEKLVIKPRKGFFGAGVKVVDSSTDLYKIQSEIKDEVIQNSKTFSPDVFSADEMIIEEYIDGEEYTVDMYYNSKGDPIIVNLDHHPLSINPEYFHLLYFTSKEVFQENYQEIVSIFSLLNKTLKLKDIAIHAEFKKCNGILVPIEFNILRYGGFGLADLPYNAFGSNSIKHFFDGTAPNWKEIWRKYPNNYGWVLCYVPKEINTKKFKPDLPKLKARIGKILKFYNVDYKSNPVMGIAYVECSSKKELEKLLNIEFKEFFTE